MKTACLYNSVVTDVLIIKGFYVVIFELIQLSKWFQQWLMISGCCFTAKASQSHMYRGRLRADIRFVMIVLEYQISGRINRYFNWINMNFDTYTVYDSFDLSQLRPGLIDNIQLNVLLITTKGVNVHLLGLHNSLDSDNTASKGCTKPANRLHT